MKVAAKLVLVLLVGITLLLVVDSYMLVHREIGRFEEVPQEAGVCAERS